MHNKTEKEIMKNWKEDISLPLVSICCVTYNHKDYIAQAINGFLYQETDFPFEVLIHDDASTDGTTEIIRGYQEQYPNIIRTVVQDENQFSKGVRFISVRFLFPLAKGKYIALCEGDDYWTSSRKLQKQLTFMEENPEYSCCFHAVDQKDDTVDKSLSLTRLPIKGDTFYFEDVLESYLIPTLSIFFRKDLMPTDIPSYDKYMFGDIFTQLMLASQGPAYYFNEVMGVYRHHDAGVSKSMDFLSGIENARTTFHEINKITEGRYDGLIKKRMSSYEDFCYLKHYIATRNPIKSFYYFFKVILKHPSVILRRLKYKVTSRTTLSK